MARDGRCSSHAALVRFISRFSIAVLKRQGSPPDGRDGVFLHKRLTTEDTQCRHAVTGDDHRQPSRSFQAHPRAAERLEGGLFS
jgi:hypothetical protein